MKELLVVKIIISVNFICTSFDIYLIFLYYCLAMKYQSFTFDIFWWDVVRNKVIE